MKGTKSEPVWSEFWFLSNWNLIIRKMYQATKPLVAKPLLVTHSLEELVSKVFPSKYTRCKSSALQSFKLLEKMSYLETALLIIFLCFLLTIAWNFTVACLEQKQRNKIRWAVKQQQIIKSSTKVSSSWYRGWILVFRLWWIVLFCLKEGLSS